MSGGSFGYLYSKELDDYAEIIETVAKYLEKIGNSFAAGETRRCSTMLREAERIRESLKEVWHDVEWWRSGDILKEDAMVTATKWEEEMGR